MKDLDPKEPKFVVLRNAFLARLAASSSVTTPGSALQPATVHRIIAVHNTAVYSKYYPVLFEEMQREEALGQRLVGSCSAASGLFNERRLFGSTLPTMSCSLPNRLSADSAAPLSASFPCSLADCELCTVVRRGAPVTDHGLHQTGSGRGVYLAYEPFQAKDAGAPVSDVSAPVIRAAVLYVALLGDMEWVGKPDPSFRFPATTRSLVIEHGHVPEVLLRHSEGAVPIYVYLFSTSAVGHSTQ